MSVLPAPAPRPRLLDLFCGGGGAAMGYHLAGFDVVGVDIAPQPLYPFPFVEADALTFPLDGFDAIHASPPCQAYTALRAIEKRAYPELVEPTRARLRTSGVPWVMENVPGSPLLGPYRICGGALGLGSGSWHLRRHRYFEASFVILTPGCHHFGEGAIGVYGGGKAHHRSGGYTGSKAEAAEAMGIDWLPKRLLAQAIPPAYTELIGYQLRAQLAVVA